MSYILALVNLKVLEGHIETKVYFVSVPDVRIDETSIILLNVSSFFSKKIEWTIDLTRILTVFPRQENLECKNFERRSKTFQHVNEILKFYFC